jgi:hypothetical protein
MRYFYHEVTVKRYLLILSAITVVDLLHGSSVLLTVREWKCNDTANHSPLSEFQLRYFGVKIYKICHKHEGTYKMVKRDDRELLVISLELYAV